MFKLSIETLGTESENVKRCGSAFATALNVRDLQQQIVHHQSKNRNSRGVTIWLVVSTPLKKIYIVSWDDYSQYMEK